MFKLCLAHILKPLKNLQHEAKREGKWKGREWEEKQRVCGREKGRKEEGRKEGLGRLKDKAPEGLENTIDNKMLYTVLSLKIIYNIMKNSGICLRKVSDTELSV